MVAKNESMMSPELEDLLSKVDSKFSLVTLAATRARDLQQYYAKMGSLSTKVIPPQVASLRKPLSMAFEEIALDKIVRVSADEMKERAEAEAAAMADAAEFAIIGDDAPVNSNVIVEDLIGLPEDGSPES
jgi:DNA-directed RNA polymerase subunit omega